MKATATLLFAGILSLLLFTAAAQDNVEITPPPTAEAAPAAAPAQSPAAPPAGWVQQGEFTVVDPATGESNTQPIYGPPPTPIFQLYLEAGYTWMTAITLCLIAMLFAAWKAPRWLKELGLLAMVIGLFALLLGFYEIADIIRTQGIEIGKDMSSTLLFSGLRVALIAPMYGLLVYGISLILRIVVKPRI